MAAPLTCPGCGRREGVRLVMGSPPVAAREPADHPPPSPSSSAPVTDAACRACGAQWASSAAPSR